MVAAIKARVWPALLIACVPIWAQGRTDPEDLYQKAISLMGEQGTAVAAVPLLEAAAGEGHSKATVLLGVLYYSGSHGVERNLVRAATILEGGAEAGVPDALFYLALIKATDNGPGRDPARARELYLKAAQQGHQLAQYFLALMIETGTGGPANRIAAGRWFARAAQGADSRVGAKAAKSREEIEKYTERTDRIGAMGWMAGTLGFAAVAAALIGPLAGGDGPPQSEGSKGLPDRARECANKLLFTDPSPQATFSLCLFLNP